MLCQLLRRWNVAKRLRNSRLLSKFENEKTVGADRSIAASIRQAIRQARQRFGNHIRHTQVHMAFAKCKLCSRYFFKLHAIAHALCRSCDGMSDSIGFCNPWPGATVSLFTLSLVASFPSFTRNSCIEGAGVFSLRAVENPKERYRFHNTKSEFGTCWRSAWSLTWIIFMFSSCTICIDLLSQRRSFTLSLHRKADIENAKRLWKCNIARNVST